MKKYLSLLALLFLAGCASNNSSINEESKESTSNSTQEVTEETKQTSFCYIDFTTADITKGSQFVGDNNINNLNKLKDHMNADVEIISSLSAEGKVNYNQCKRGDTKSVVIGSQSDSGKLTLNFALEVVKIELNVENYWKYVDYNNTYSMDTASKLHIGNEVVDLSNNDTENDPVPTLKTCEYNTPINSLELYNESYMGRVILNSIKITYIVD